MVETNETIPQEMQVGKPTKEDIERVESMFIHLCRNTSIKWGTKKFYEYQHIYFSGAIMMCNYSVVSWSVAMMGQRPIVDKF